jgi:hypothetical protein
MRFELILVRQALYLLSHSTALKKFLRPISTNKKPGHGGSCLSSQLHKSINRKILALGVDESPSPKITR